MKKYLSIATILLILSFTLSITVFAFYNPTEKNTVSNENTTNTSDIRCDLPLTTWSGGTI